MNWVLFNFYSIFLWFALYKSFIFLVKVILNYIILLDSAINVIALFSFYVIHCYL